MAVTLTFTALITGCSSSSEVPLETSYYLLNSPYTEQKTSEAISQTVSVNLLELPAYLHQPNLVMQLSTHQLHYARFDMWAEPLQAGLSKALINDLNLNNKNIQFIENEFLSEGLSTDKLIIRVDYFHPSAESKVILSGVFWKENHKEQKLIQQPFSFELILTEDGYTHAIEQMRALVLIMSESILLGYNE